MISSLARSPQVRKTPVNGNSAAVRAGALCANPGTHLSVTGGRESAGEKKDFFVFRFSKNVK